MCDKSEKVPGIFNCHKAVRALAEISSWRSWQSKLILPTSNKIKTKLDWLECETLFQAGRVFGHWRIAKSNPIISCLFHDVMEYQDKNKQPKCHSVPEQSYILSLLFVRFLNCFYFLNNLHVYQHLTWEFLTPNWGVVKQPILGFKPLLTCHKNTVTK